MTDRIAELRALLDYEGSLDDTDIDALLDCAEALKPFAAIPLDQAGVGESFAEIVLHARGCLARLNGEPT